MGYVKFRQWRWRFCSLRVVHRKEPPPPPKTVFDPLTQQIDHAREVQKTVDENAEKTRQAVDAQERGAPTPNLSAMNPLAGLSQAWRWSVRKILGLWVRVTIKPDDAVAAIAARPASRVLRAGAREPDGLRGAQQRLRASTICRGPSGA